MDYSRLLSAGLRHQLAWNSGEDFDPESGLNHLAHACANMLMLLEYQLLDQPGDDRAEGLYEKD
jgi:hypothetical protein